MGFDFLLTRNRTGAGFLDGHWPEPQATRLARAARQFPEVEVYVGDDGKIYGVGYTYGHGTLANPLTEGSLLVAGFALFVAGMIGYAFGHGIR